MIDQQMRPLFAMKQALTLPLGVFGTEADFTNYQIRSPALENPIELAVCLSLPFHPQKD